MIEKFDHIIEPEHGVEYGVLDGWQSSDTVFFLKLPSGDSLHGKSNKYYRFARELRKRTHCYVICAENHGDEFTEKYDLEVLSQYSENRSGEIRSCRIIGFGDGATVCLSWIYHKKEIEKMLLINMPISYELGETVELLSSVDKKIIKFIYGDGDPSYRFTPLLRRMYADVHVMQDVDHNFTGRTYSFVGLQELI